MLDKVSNHPYLDIAGAMQTMKIEMKQEKVTKNTIRYAAIDEDSPVPTVYVKKAGLSDPAPKAITLIIEVEDDVRT